MNASFFFRVLLWAAMSLFAAGACEGEPVPPPMPEPPPPSMQAFGAANADCLEWTNACLVCSRLALAPDPEATDTVVDKGGESHDGESRHTEMACSTPGIACQPKEVSCTAMRPPGPP